MRRLRHQLLHQRLGVSHQQLPMHSTVMHLALMPSFLRCVALPSQAALDQTGPASADPGRAHMMGCRLQHFRPGTVSLSISENDDAPAMRLTPGYRNTQFLITTGEGLKNDQ